MKIKKIMKMLVGKLRSKKFGIITGHNVYIGKYCNMKGKKQIILDNDVAIRPYVQIWSTGGNVRIGEGTEIGERCRISIINSLEVGKNVLFSPNVYITDCDHEYRNPEVPIIAQGIVQKGQKVIIGDDSYIGINVVIVGNVKIGKHCVIGANSVVTKDIPEYCVAVGSPAKVVKHLKSN